MIKFSLNLIFLIILAVIQVSFLATWPAPVNSLNLILCVVMFLAIVVNYQQGLYYALAGGFFLELYTGSFFGIIILALVLTVGLVNFLFDNFFTNRSLYSLLVLGLVGTIFYNLFFLFFDFLTIVLGWSGQSLEFNLWRQFFWQPFFNLLILTIIFFTYYTFIGRLKNIFLGQHHIYEIKE